MLDKRKNGIIDIGQTLTQGLWWTNCHTQVSLTSWAFKMTAIAGVAKEKKTTITVNNAISMRTINYLIKINATIYVGGFIYLFILVVEQKSIMLQMFTCSGRLAAIQFAYISVGIELSSDSGNANANTAA